MAEENDESAFEWELSRENVQPLRGGRDAAALSAALSSLSSLHHSSILARVDEAFAVVLASFDDKSSGDSADPLDACLNFISWFEQHFPIGRQKIFYGYLWTMTKRLTAICDYADDERMLKMWRTLAANSLGNDYSVFQHANSVNSLKRCAQFYVLWSEACENRGAVEEARRVLQRAERAGALPLSLINDASDQLEMRILRKLSLHDSSDDDNSDIENEESRKALTRLSGLDALGTAPVVRLPSISGENASSRLKSTTSAVKKKNPKNNSIFEVCMEVEEEGWWLEEIYDLHCEPEKLLQPENLKPSHSLFSSTSSSITSSATAPFEVWVDGAQPKRPKARLMLKKLLIRDLSIEEALVEKMSVLFEPLSPIPNQINRPKQLHLCKADIKPLSFD